MKKRRRKTPPAVAIYEREDPIIGFLTTDYTEDTDQSLLIVIAMKPQADAAIHPDRNVVVPDGLLCQPFGPATAGSQ